jgi:hypothetical protein
LRAVGLPERIVEDEADYFALASALAADPQRLAALRQKLADNRQDAPLFDVSGYARHLEGLFRAIWGAVATAFPARRSNDCSGRRSNQWLSTVSAYQISVNGGGKDRLFAGGMLPRPMRRGGLPSEN